MKETLQYVDVLRQLKDFDENRGREIAAKAYQEQEVIQLEVNVRIGHSDWSKKLIIHKQ